MKIERAVDLKAVSDFFLASPWKYQYHLGHMATGSPEATEYVCAYEGGDISDVCVVMKGRYRYCFLFAKDENTAGDLFDAAFKDFKGEFGIQADEAGVLFLKKRFPQAGFKAYTQYKLETNILLPPAIKHEEYIYRINESDFEALEEFFKGNHPDHWFLKHMLKTGHYYCARKNSKILAAAGVHFASKEFSTAAIGNVVTAADERGKGWGKIISAYTAMKLWGEFDRVGLRAEKTNDAANKIYLKLGFLPVNEVGIGGMTKGEEQG